MAADQERAERIRQLKQDHPEFTWEQIAHHVGVTPRAAQGWQVTGSIAYTNAKKLAELFDEIDVDWIMRGPRPETPDLMGALDGRRTDLDERLAAIEREQSETNRLLRELLGRKKPLRFPPVKDTDEDNAAGSADTG